MKFTKGRSFARAFTAMMCICMCVCVCVCTHAHADDPEYGRVIRYTVAYLEPIEDEITKAGCFAYESNIVIRSRLEDDWVEAEYYYDASKLPDANEAVDALSGTRIVFLKESSVLPVLNNTVDLNNIILPEEDIPALSVTHGVFEPLLLVDMNYNPNAARTTESGLTFTTRTKAVGVNADNRDILLVQTKMPYENSSKFIYLPEIRLDGELKYPINGLSYNYPSATQPIEYEVNNDLVQDQRVLAGLRFILENAPPYKVYTSCSTDYTNASRTAACIAIRSFLCKTINAENWINIYDSIEAYSTEEFGPDYFGYTFWLYEKALDIYFSHTENETPYISCDIEKEPELVNGSYVSTIRITTNAENGWRIEKNSLPGYVEKIENAKENSEEYYGEKGSSLITVVAAREAIGNILELPVLYNSNDPIIQISETKEEQYPALISLSKQDASKPPRRIIIHYPSPIEFTVNVVSEETGRGISGIHVILKDETGHENEQELDSEGTAVFSCLPGEYTYDVVNLPGIYETLETGNIRLLESENISVKCKKKKISAEIKLLDAFTLQPIEASCDVEIYNDSENPVLWRSVTITGNSAVLEDIAPGKYFVRQITDIKGYEIANDLRFIVETENVTVPLKCDPISGKVVITSREKPSDKAIGGLSMNIVRDNATVMTVETDNTGIAVIPKLPTGDYVLVLADYPLGYSAAKTQATSIKFTVHYQQQKDILINLSHRELSLRVYPREEDDKGQMNQWNAPAVSGICSLEGITYQIIADEGNTFFPEGKVVTEFGETSGKGCMSILSFAYTGNYIIHEKNPGKGYLPAEDLRVTFTDEQTAYDIRIPKVPVQKSIHIRKTDNKGKAISNTTFLIYRSKFNSYKDAPKNHRTTVITDENGKAEINLLYGDWTIEQETTESGNRLRAGLTINAEAEDHKELAFVGETAPCSVRIRVLNEREQIVSQDSVFELYKNGRKILDIEVNGEDDIGQALATGAYTLHQSSAGYDYSPAEDLSFELTSDEPVTRILEVHNAPRNKNLSVSVSVPVMGEIRNSTTDNNGITVAVPQKQYVNISGVNIVIRDALFSSETNISIPSSSEGSIVTTPLQLMKYYVIAQNLPEGYYLNINPINIDLRNTAESFIPVDIRLTPRTTAISFCPHEIVSGDKNGAIYGLYACPMNYASESDWRENSLLLEAKKVQDGKIFFFNDYPAGKYFISPVQDIDGTPNLEAVSEFEIQTPGKTVSIMEAPNEYHEITVMTRDSFSGKILDNAFIRITAEDKVLYEGYPDGGTHTIDLKAGEYRITPVLAPEGYALPEEVYFTVQPDGSVKGSKDILFDETILRVREVDASGIPVQGADLQLVETSTKHSIHIITDVNGVAEFRGIGYGDYEISECFPAPGNIENNDRVLVSVNGSYRNNTASIPVLHTEMNRMEFKIMDSSGNSLPNAEIALYDSQGNLTQSVRSGEDGMAAFTSLPYGVYKARMTYSPEMYLKSNTEYTITVSRQTQYVFNQISTYVCVPKHAAFRLINNNGEGVSGAAFTMIDKSTAKEIETEISGPDGSFEFCDFNYGEYLIRETSVPEGTSFVEDIEFIIDKTWQANTVTVLRTAPDYYEMKSMDNKGSLLPGAKFAAMNTETGHVIFATADQEGLVHIKGLRFGDYEIQEAGVPEGYEVSREVIRVHVREDYEPPKTLYIYITRKME